MLEYPLFASTQPIGIFGKVLHLSEEMLRLCIGTPRVRLGDNDTICSGIEPGNYKTGLTTKRHVLTVTERAVFRVRSDMFSTPRTSFEGHMFLFNSRGVSISCC
jgi:hypothetical protein